LRNTRSDCIKKVREDKKSQNEADINHPLFVCIFNGICWSTIRIIYLLSKSRVDCATSYAEVVQSQQIHNRNFDSHAFPWPFCQSKNW